jgi:ABC-type amino acid transport substrate-binding protein
MHEGFPVLKRTTVLVIWALIALGASSQGVAGGREDAWQRGKLLVGVKSDFPPFGYVDESGVQRGFDVEIAQYLAKALFDDSGDRLELVPVTSGSRIPFLYNGWIDVIVASMTVTEERKRVLEFSDPYFHAGSLILVLKESPVSGLKNLATKRVGVLEGAVQQKDLDQIAPQAIRVEFATLGDAVEALKGKRVDALCTDDVAALFLAQKDQELTTVGTPFNPHPYAIGVRKGDTEFLKWINKQLTKMKEDGTYERFWQKYLEAPAYQKLWQKSLGEPESQSPKP